MTKPTMPDDWTSCDQTLEGHSQAVQSVTFSHDDKRLASASGDHTVKIWDAASGACLQTLEVSTTLDNISFDTTDQYLCTEIGAIILDILPTSKSIIEYQKLRRQDYGLSPDRVWIMCDSENLLWLPSEYRPSASVVTTSAVAIGCGTGRVLIFNFMIHDSFSY